MAGADSVDVEMPYPHYRCPVCGKELPLTQARITTTCAEHARVDVAPGFTVRAAKPGDRGAVEEICDRVWGETEIDCFGRTFDVLAGQNVVAESGGELAGLLSVALDRGELAIVMLSVYPGHQGVGIGAALVEEAVRRAEAANVPLVKAAATNDDIPALYFYQRHGFVIYEIATGSVADRHGAVLSGFAGIPVRDEVRLRRPACLK